MKKITLLLAMMFVCFLGNAQTPLTAGDIAFLGGNSDGATNADDNFAFVLLKILMLRPQSFSQTEDGTIRVVSFPTQVTVLLHGLQVFQGLQVILSP